MFGKREQKEVQINRDSYWGGRRIERKVIVLICLMACTIFCVLYGIGKLNPGYTDWLLFYEDSTIQYIGGQAFKQSPWMFPFGNLNTLHYPDTSSVIFTDSIPLLAMIYKLVSPLVNGTYQYVGIWVLLCYITTGLLSGKIFSRFIKNKVVLLIGVAIVLLNPVMANRYYAHASLMGQWTILLSAIPFVYYDYWQSDSSKMLKFSFSLGALMPSVHMYFLLENGIVLFAYCLYDAIKRKKYLAELGNLIMYCLGGAVSIFLLGGFSGTRSFWGGAGGFGEYSFNLNGFINSQGCSSIFDGLKNGENQYEGFSYLGFGMILLLIAVVILLFASDQSREWIKTRKAFTIVFAVFCLISVLISTSPKIMLGKQVLFEIPFPRIIQRIWGIFRATGRLIWPLYYCLFFVGIILAARLITEKRLIVIVLSVCLILQVVDLYPLYSSKSVADDMVYQTNLDENKWDEIIDKTETKHLVLMGIDARELYDFGLYAISKGLTLNTFRIAHGGLSYVEAAEKAIRSREKGNLYVFHNLKDSADYPELKCSEMDSFWIGVPMGNQ